MKKRISTLALAAGLVILPGCVDVEQTVKLEKDLAGQTSLSIHVDLEPLILPLFRIMRQKAGLESEPTAAEIAEVTQGVQQRIQQFLASQEEESGESTEAQKQKIKDEFPPGIKLLESSLKEEEGLKVNGRWLFEFDHIAKIPQIKLSGTSIRFPGVTSIDLDLFKNLAVNEDGATLLLTMGPLAPVEQQQDLAKEFGLPPEIQEPLKQAYQNRHYVFKLEAPFEVIEHNASRREGQTLIWEYDLQTLEKMTPEQLAQGLRVRFKK